MDINNKFFFYFDIGTQTHQLIFSYEKDGKEVLLECFLNDWDLSLMPVGLIPDMRLIVKNVITQNQKFLKSSVFTTFELIAYEPEVEFSTVDL